jgi:hypothetical protein
MIDAIDGLGDILERLSFEVAEYALMSRAERSQN